MVRVFRCPACGVVIDNETHYVGAGLYFCNPEHRTAVDLDESDYDDDEESDNESDNESDTPPS